MSLPELWFILIAVLWSGYFLLEGFDFGVGMLLPFLPRGERDRQAMFASIGPVWDGNEVWLVVAGAATFAAFPAWYATVFSGFYLALLLVLVLLIVRVVSFEWYERGDSPRWRGAWRWANTAGSVGLPFVWGVALANFAGGVPLDSNGHYAGGFWDLFSAYTVLAGIAMVLLCAFHGAAYLTLRTEGTLCERAAAAARRLAIPAAVAIVDLLAWTVAIAVDRNDKDVFPPILPAVVGGAALILAAVLAFMRRGGWAFVMTALGTVATVATIFTSLYPRVLVSRPDFANSLTVANASSAHYTLAVLTVVAVIFLPLVLLYQAWTYHVFRARLRGEEPANSPAAALAPRTDERVG